MAEAKKSKLTNTHKTFLAGAGGALVAMVLVLGSVGVVRAFNGPKPHDGGGRMGMTMQGGQGHGGMRGGPGGMGGEVTKIDGNTITLKGQNDETTITVKVDDNTNYQKDGEDAKLSDLKVGDKIMIRGDATSIAVDADAIGIRE